MSAQPRHGSGMTPQHMRNYSGSGLQQSQQQSHQPSNSYSYEALQTPTVGQLPPQPTISTPHSTQKEEFGIDDGDVAMEDADPYNRMKYPSRHSNRTSMQYLPQEESAAARRYSPMNTFSPTSPYTASSPQQPTTAYNPYTPQSLSARQSPNRTNAFSTPSQQYYPSNGNLYLQPRSNSYTDTDSPAPARHPLQLSPINANDAQSDQYFPNSATVQLNAVFGREVKSPRQPYPQHHGPKGPIPRVKRLKNASDIQARVHTQPAFRRANPEGGFISVS